MTNRLVLRSIFAVSSAALLLGSTAATVHAAAQQDGGQGGNPEGRQRGQGGQGGQGGFRGQGGGRGGFGGQGGFGMPGGMMGRPMSATNLSLRLMSTYLNLNDSQVSKIALARDDMQEASRPTPPPRGANGGNPPDMQSMMAEMAAKRDSAEKKAVAEIRAVLTEEQATKLAALLKAMEAFQTAGFRPDAAGALRLTEEQINRLARGGTPATVLTAEQMTIAETYRMPPPGMRGPGGGRGGRGPGGQGGPGGPGAPPPPEGQGI